MRKCELRDRAAQAQDYPFDFNGLRGSGEKRPAANASCGRIDPIHIV
jgi:hypothetical protein